MDPATIGLLIGGGLTLITALLTTVINTKMSEGKEERAEKLKAALTRKSERIAALEKVYSDALALLNLTRIKSGAIHAKDFAIVSEIFDQTSRLNGILELTATQEVIGKYYDVLLIANGLVFEGLDEPKIADDQKERDTAYMKAYKELSRLMRAHLDAEIGLS